jgi:hypothetical protein
MWLDGIPENLQGSQIAEQLQEAIDQIQAAVGVLDVLDLPRGFGR